MLDARLVTFAVGQIVDDADEILHVAVFALYRQPNGGDDADTVARRDDGVFVDIDGRPQIDQFLIVLADRFDGFLWHDFCRGLAEDHAAIETEILLGGAVEQHISQLRILHDDRGRHVFDDLVEKRAGALQAALGALALSDILVRRHPAAAFHRMVGDGNGAAVVQFDIEREGLALLERRVQLGFVAMRIEREGSSGDARVEQVADAAAAPNALRVELYIDR